MTTPVNDVTHQAFISIEAPPRPACGGIGASTLRADEVTCLACLELRAARRARIAAEPHDEADRDLCAKGDCGECAPGSDRWAIEQTRCICGKAIEKNDARPEWHHAGSGLLVCRDGGSTATPVPAAEEIKPARPCPSCPQCGKTFHVSDEEIAAAEAIGDPYPAAEPAKTHDLSIRRTSNGNAVIEVSNETDDYTVYLLDGTAQDLGRALDALTPAQRQLLIGELTGGRE